MQDVFQSTASSLWDDTALDYEERSYFKKNSLYPANLFRAEILLNFFESKAKGRVLDAGCGTGFMTRQLLKRGWEVTSLDYSERMLQVAKSKAEQENLRGDFQLGQVANLPDLKEKYDFVMLNGVLPYIDLKSEEAVYRGVATVLNSGGFFISSHYNTLFDMFSYSDKTAHALRDIVSTTEVPNTTLEKVHQIMVESLDSLPDSSDRTMKTENPFTYPEKLRSHGFLEIDRAYYNFYYLPERFEEDQDPKLREAIERKYNRDWQGMFLAKTFISIAQLPTQTV